MRNLLLIVVALYVALYGLSVPAQAQQPPAKDPNCGRACLEGYMNRYLEAMMNNDVSDDLFARNTRFTENGIEFLRAVKSDEQLRGIPVVVLTTSREESDLAASQELGAAGYIAKPLDFAQFLDATRTYSL